MKSIRLLGVGLALLACGALLAQEEKTEPNFVGTWTIVAGEKGGEKLPPDRYEGTAVKFTRDTITVTNQKNKQNWIVKYEVDLGKRPHPIRMTTVEGPGPKGGTAVGVIQMQDDTLKLAYSPAEGKAPTDFTTKSGQEQLLFVMKRAK